MNGVLRRSGYWLILASLLLAPFSGVWSAYSQGQEPLLIDTPYVAAVDTIQLNEVVGRVLAMENELRSTKGLLNRLQDKLSALETKNAAHENRVASLDTNLSTLQADASKLQQDAEGIRNDLGRTGKELEGRIETVDQRYGRHWWLTLLMVVLLGVLLGAGYWALQRFFGQRVGAVDAELIRINTDVQAKLVKVDAELVSSLEKLMQAKPAPAPAAVEVDHSLPLKMADEVTRIEQNLAQMDAAVKGHKQLTAAVKRMHENLQAAGYQLPELLGKSFDEGMKVLPSFVHDDKLKEGERIITRVFKPTVLYKGQMIQVGEVQVSTGN